MIKAVKTQGTWVIGWALKTKIAASSLPWVSNLIEGWRQKECNKRCSGPFEEDAAKNSGFARVGLDFVLKTTGIKTLYQLKCLGDDPLSPHVRRGSIIGAVLFQDSVRDEKSWFQNALITKAEIL